MREIREEQDEEVGKKVLRELHIQLNTLNAKKLGLGPRTPMARLAPMTTSYDAVTRSTQSKSSNRPQRPLSSFRT